jgi:hypothetical protein
MNKKELEIITCVTSVGIFVILIVSSRLIIPTLAGYGYTAALLIFVVIMSLAGLKLAEIPDK